MWLAVRCQFPLVDGLYAAGHRNMCQYNVYVHLSNEALLFNIRVIILQYNETWLGLELGSCTGNLKETNLSGPKQIRVVSGA